MSAKLPKPIELYFTAENAGDLSALGTFLSSDATVHDEGQTHVGLAAIRQWKLETKKKYGHTIEPLRALDRDGKVVVAGRVSGNFPGSPATLQFSFKLSSDKIESLEIHG